jgi:flagellar biosynthesis/type III secretory pathway protein FliH
MATIIRLADSPHPVQPAALNFDDLAAQAGTYVAEVKAEAAEIIAQARRQADSIRQQAANEGAQAAVNAVEQMVAEQLAPALSALQQAAADLHGARQAWLSHWESNVVHLATAIAQRIVRDEVRRRPEITLALVREALELAAGSPGVRLQLSPEDHKALGAQVRALIDAMSSLGVVEVAADPAIGRGGCRVETRFGAIDQQIESQLKRIEEELTG